MNTGARMWLDLARYADSSGYADDPPRTIWGFRDYVIKSLNANKPFDQFTIEQIAGDLLPNPTADQLVATAFHRQHAHQQRRWNERRRISQRGDRRSSEHDDGGLDGHDYRLCPMSQSQV